MSLSHFSFPPCFLAVPRGTLHLFFPPFYYTKRDMYEKEVEEGIHYNVGGSEKIQDEYAYRPESHLSFNTQRTHRDLQEGTKRGLDARHVQMIALGGTIG